MNKLPESRLAAIARAAWPSTRAADALSAVARHAGLPVLTADTAVLPAETAPDLLAAWLDAAAAQAGLQVDQAFVALHEIDALLAGSAPAMIRLAELEGKYLAIVGASARTVRALGPDLRIHRLRLSEVRAAIRAPFESSVAKDIEPIVERMPLREAAKARARAAIIEDRLKTARFRGCWLVRLPPGTALADEAREAGLPRRIAMLTATHALQYALFIGSWWLLGRGVLNDTIDSGWLWGWLLLLLSLIPLRLVASWNQGVAAVTVGAWLRRRLLRGAFLADRQEIKRKGAGQLFSVIVEAGAIDALAVTGGIVAILSVLELLVATVVLAAGAGWAAAPLLTIWVLMVGALSWAYYRRRQAWTRERLGMTHHLLESMVGHRTRLAQQSEGQRHLREDESLEAYALRSDAMDRLSVWLTAIVPRGWLVVALLVLTPTMVRGATAGRLAVSIGGAILAYRALQRLTAGVSSAAGALVAAESVSALVNAASRREAGTPPDLVIAPRVGEAADVVMQAHDIAFQYRSGPPVLQNCSLNIARRTRFMLEGASGSGKTTFASIVAGLQNPDSGLMLAGGLDRAALGAAGWRRRVVMAPQAHDNYLLSASLAFNLLMGCRWPAERTDLVEADAVCRELGLGDLLDQLPSGLDQIVGENGWQLSQGERVRVFLARALLQRPDLLVLDESFSALDAENVDRAMRCVAHRAPSVLAIAHP